MSTARDRISRGEFGIRQTYQDIDETGKGKSERRRALAGAYHQAEGDIDVGADIGIAPHVRTPHRYVTAQFGGYAVRGHCCLFRCHNRLCHVTLQPPDNSAPSRRHINSGIGGPAYALLLINGFQGVWDDFVRATSRSDSKPLRPSCQQSDLTHQECPRNRIPDSWIDVRHIGNELLPGVRIRRLPPTTRRAFSTLSRSSLSGASSDRIGLYEVFQAA